MSRANTLSGEINVETVMAEQAHMREWQQRQQRDAEWVALKQLWQAERALRRATSPQARRQALIGWHETIRLYQAELGRAWPKWERVMAERRRLSRAPRPFSV